MRIKPSHWAEIAMWCSDVKNDKLGVWDKSNTESSSSELLYQKPSDFVQPDYYIQSKLFNSLLFDVIKISYTCSFPFDNFSVNY